MNFGQVTEELKRVKCERHTPLVNQHFIHVRLAVPLLRAVGISIEFCWAINT